MLSNGHNVIWVHQIMGAPFSYALPLNHIYDVVHLLHSTVVKRKKKLKNEK